MGFTEYEVKKLCGEYGSDFEMMKQWYDGYSFRELPSVYNPNSVMKAIYNDDFDSYWTQTSAAESLMEYISLDFDGLGKTVSELIGGAGAYSQRGNPPGVCQVGRLVAAELGPNCLLLPYTGITTAYHRARLFSLSVLETEPRTR